MAAVVRQDLVGLTVSAYPCPYCPVCGDLPGFTISPEQVFCTNKSCPAITWNMTIDRDENLADANFISLFGHEKS